MYRTLPGRASPCFRFILPKSCRDGIGKKLQNCCGIAAVSYLNRPRKFGLSRRVESAAESYNLSILPTLGEVTILPGAADD